MRAGNGRTITKTERRLSRILHGPALETGRGQLALAAVLVTLFLASKSAFREYYTVYPLQLLAGITMACVLYIPTLAALRHFDRREREPSQLVLFAILSVTFFFGPVTSRSLEAVDHFFASTLVVGFIEEFWKVAPLLLLLAFLPRA